MNNLEKHAEYEMRLAGLYDANADYGGMIPDAVMALVKAHAEQCHSGFSHGMVIDVFNRVINFKTLTPLTSNPDEWVQLDENVGGPNMWQNRRQCSCFSTDGGKTWYDIDKPEVEK